MALKKKYAKADEIPQAHKDLYKQVGSEWLLDVDGDEGGGDDNLNAGDLARKLKDFRSNNTKLAEELKAERTARQQMEKRLEILGKNDDERVTTALALLDKVTGQADEELIKAGRFDEVVARRMKARETDWQKKIEAEAAKLKAAGESEAKARSIAAGMVLDQHVRKEIAAKKLRLRGTAEDDLMNRARRDWRANDTLDGVAAVAQDAAYDNIGAWLDKQVSDAPHLWEGGEGGGAGGGGGSGGGGGNRTVKRSDISDKDYANVLADGKTKVVLQ